MTHKVRLEKTMLRLPTSLKLLTPGGLAAMLEDQTHSHCSITQPRHQSHEGRSLRDDPKPHHDVSHDTT